MIKKDFEDQYNLSKNRPDLKELLASWSEQSRLIRRTTQCFLNIAYGTSQREKLDLFLVAEVNNPILIYLHGGYWQRGNKDIYSFLAQPFVCQNINVAIINYGLAPYFELSRIIEHVKSAIEFLWTNSFKFGFSREKIHIMGHSAGGHLSAMMMTTSWPNLEKSPTTFPIKSSIHLSLISDLKPLRETSINLKLKLSDHDIRNLSPLYIPPVTNAPQLIAWGEKETKEFERQSNDYINKYSTVERKIEGYIVPDVDHYDIINKLVDSDSIFFQKILSQLKEK